MSGPGAARARLAELQEGALHSGRLPALELAGARFSGVRCVAHVGRDPPDLALAPGAAGVLCADVFRDGVVLVLDLPRRRCAVVQMQQPAAG